ncbi:MULTISPECIES: hypothetical protein [unclassified Streptomyces]|uniref:hypothetical protein n=1 Tax=unclassified Streptomyces TaxID=2593676 RepID=UPI000ADE6547|nr:MULTISPECIES: hypothetical protein [unclassified Streptomyces]
MRHMPFFRWVLTLGFVLFACAAGVYAAGTDDWPDTQQIDLTVIDEKPDGSCRVQWHDPFQERTREAAYHCDPGRGDLLKAPQYSAHEGWETGFLLTEGPERGNLEELAPEPTRPEDVLLLLAIPLIALGLVGGNLRALPRVLGVQARLVRRTTELSGAARRAAEDYERAVSAVREAHRHTALGQGDDDAPTSPLVTALWVLREAGPEARETALLGQVLTERLNVLLDDAAPAAGLRSMLGAGPVARQHAALAVAELRPLLAAAERDGLPERFAQTSVDMLRGQDTNSAALAAAADFARDPEPYELLLARLAGPAVPARTPSPRRARWLRRR